MIAADGFYAHQTRFSYTFVVDTNQITLVTIEARQRREPDVSGTLARFDAKQRDRLMRGELMQHYQKQEGPNMRDRACRNQLADVFKGMRHLSAGSRTLRS